MELWISRLLATGAMLALLLSRAAPAGLPKVSGAFKSPEIHEGRRPGESDLAGLAQKPQAPAIDLHVPAPVPGHTPQVVSPSLRPSLLRTEQLPGRPSTTDLLGGHLTRAPPLP